MKQFWTWTLGLSLFIIFACGAVSYLQMTVSAFFAGRNVPRTYLSAVLLMIVCCYALIREGDERRREIKYEDGKAQKRSDQ